VTYPNCGANGARSNAQERQISIYALSMLCIIDEVLGKTAVFLHLVDGDGAGDAGLASLQADAVRVELVLAAAELVDTGADHGVGGIVGFDILLEGHALGRVAAEEPPWLAIALHRGRVVLLRLLLRLGLLELARNRRGFRLLLRRGGERLLLLLGGGSGDSRHDFGCVVRSLWEVCGGFIGKLLANENFE